jgi:ACS family tartrate transporter-like MFS transporter
MPSAGPVLVSQHYVPFAESSWRWLLILEGLPAVTFAILVPFLLPSRPAEARFLTASEKAWIAEQLEREDRPNWAQRDKPFRGTDSG